MALSSAGLGSGLDIPSIIKSLMAVEQQPLQRLVAQEASVLAKITAYGSLKGAMSSFQSVMQKLGNADAYTTLTATSSANDSVGISAGKNAAETKFSIEVSQLAQNQKLASSTFASASSVVGTGTMTIDFGQYTTVAEPAPPTTSFTANTAKTSKNITIDASNNTLTGVRDAINKADAGVTASIVNDGTGFRLAIVSNDTGENNALRIGTDVGLTALAYNASTGASSNMTQTQGAQNAKFKIDGIDISKPSNSVTDAISDVTLTISKVTTAPVNLSVSKNTAAMSKLAQDFVKGFNDLNKTLNDLSAYDAKTGKAGLLNGDSTVRQIQGSLRNMLNQSLSHTGGDFKTLSAIGFSVDKTGVMSLNESKFKAAMDKDAQGVVSLLASNGRASDSLVRIDTFASTTTAFEGKLSVLQNATQASVSSAALPSLTVNGTNKTFSILVDGTAANITLNEGVYTAAQLAAEIQTRINSDSAIKDAGAAVNVAIGADNKVTLSSQKYGSASKVAITSDLMGGGIAAEVSGVNVKAMLDGIEKEGIGQQISLENGVKFSVLGGAASSPDGASRGSISFSRGFAYQIDKLLTDALASKGAVNSRVNGLNESVKNIKKQTDQMNLRLIDTEQRYRTQFTALDISLAKIQQTSSWLTAQLASLSKNS